MMAGDKDKVGGGGDVGDDDGRGSGVNVVLSGSDNCDGIQVVMNGDCNSNSSDEEDRGGGGGDGDACLVLSGKDDVVKVILRRKDSEEKYDTLTVKETPRMKKNSFIKINFEEEEEEEEGKILMRRKKKETPMSQCLACLGCPKEATAGVRCVLIG